MRAAGHLEITPDIICYQGFVACADCSRQSTGLPVKFRRYGIQSLHSHIEKGILNITYKIGRINAAFHNLNIINRKDISYSLLFQVFPVVEFARIACFFRLFQLTFNEKKITVPNLRENRIITIVFQYAVSPFVEPCNYINAA